ncbi:MAG: roadblock/LC7 domain-containing protein [Candidatus Lokiarchaeota archaeon]|nr:roadblock/LC7 domain-containing protein [Candidatus Lokiarchaeota archaeon]
MEPYINGEFFAGLPGIPGVEASAIISADGIPIWSNFPQDFDESRIAAMTATLLSLSKKAIVEMKKGIFNEMYIKSSEGYLLVMQAGQNAILIVSTRNDVRFGELLFDCRRMCENIAKLI